MANTQINVTKNGTTTLATAGKYCDRNIDVNVNVPGKSTQFTNLYDPDNVTLDYRMNCSSSSGIAYTADAEANYIKVPFHHKAGESFALRMRGISTVRSRLDLVILEEDGETRINHGQWSSYAASRVSYDEHGDCVISFSDSFLVSNEWWWIMFNFQYPFHSSAAEKFVGPIITINEPIGNGGHAE